MRFAEPGLRSALPGVCIVLGQHSNWNPVTIADPHRVVTSRSTASRLHRPLKYKCIVVHVSWVSPPGGIYATVSSTLLWNEQVYKLLQVCTHSFKTLVLGGVGRNAKAFVYGSLYIHICPLLVVRT